MSVIHKTEQKKKFNKKLNILKITKIMYIQNRGDLVAIERIFWINNNNQ